MQTIYLTEKNKEEAIKAACAVLASGGLIIYPTETVYGVGVDATNPDAVTKLLAYKNRPAGKAISVVVFDQAAAEKLVELSSVAIGAYAAFLPGPVTVISQSRNMVDSRLVSEKNTLGIRISSHEFVSALTAEYHVPITTTSANPSGGARPYSISKLLEQLSSAQLAKIDLIIDAGDLPRIEPSTVIDTTSDVQEVVRAGSTHKALTKPIETYSSEETVEKARQIMGQFLHVLPEKPLVFALEGDMGMGKTQFAKGVAQALNVPGIVSSPTYNLAKEYKGNVNGQQVMFLHVDCWRAQQITAHELGLMDYLHVHTVILIEWATPLHDWLKSLGTEAVVQRIVFTARQGDERVLQIVAL